MKLRFLLTLCAFFPPHAHAEPGIDIAAAGTLLSFYSKNIEPGHIAVSPFIFLTNNYAFYGKNWSLKNQKNIYEAELLFVVEVGLNKYVDLGILLDGIYTKVGSQDSLQLADTLVFLGFQLVQEKKDTNIPDVRFIFGESFPTGQHDNLDVTGTVGILVTQYPYRAPIWGASRFNQMVVEIISTLFLQTFLNINSL